MELERMTVGVSPLVRLYYALNEELASIEQQAAKLSETAIEMCYTVLRDPESYTSKVDQREINDMVEGFKKMFEVLSNPHIDRGRSYAFLSLMSVVYYDCAEPSRESREWGDDKVWWMPNIAPLMLNTDTKEMISAMMHLMECYETMTYKINDYVREVINKEYISIDLPVYDPYDRNGALMMVRVRSECVE